MGNGGMHQRQQNTTLNGCEMDWLEWFQVDLLLKCYPCRMVGFDIPFAFVAAGALSWRYKGARPELPLLYAGAGVAVPGLAFMEKYPVWDWQYFVDPSTLPIGTPAMFAAIVMMAGYLGTKAGKCCPRVVAGVAGLLGLFTLFTWPRTWHMGTKEEYLAGTAATLGSEFLVFAAPWLLWSGIVLAFCIQRLEVLRRAPEA